MSALNDLNKVLLIGRLEKQPVNTSGSDDVGFVLLYVRTGDVTHVVQVRDYPQAEACLNQLNKDSLVYVEGFLDQERFVIANRVHFLVKSKG